MSSRRLPLDPKLGDGASPRLHQLFVDAAIVTRETQDAVALLAPIASPTFTGTVTLPSPFTVGATSVTANGTELNLLDGVTATTAELNILDGVTATAAQINTAATAEASYPHSSSGYVPTMAAVSNCSTPTKYGHFYLRIGAFVLVVGRCKTEMTDPGTSVLSITLPVASNFTSASDASGSLSGDKTIAGYIYSDAASDKAYITWDHAYSGVEVNLGYSFMYEIK
jgi:hypothetical protein